MNFRTWLAASLALGALLCPLEAQAYTEMVLTPKEEKAYRAGVAKHDPLSEYVLGQALFLGGGVKKNTAQGLALLKKSATAGNPSAAELLGSSYAYGENGLPKDSVTAAKWLSIAVASKKYDRSAQDSSLLLALMHIRGEGVPRDVAKGIQLLELAAERGQPEAYYYLGVAYERGDGFPKNMVSAAIQYTHATDFGSVYGTRALGQFYYEGTVVPKDLRKALTYFTIAANKGDPESLYNLGVIYHRGEGVPKDPSKAYIYFSTASYGGYAKGTEAVAALERELDPNQLATLHRKAMKFYKAFPFYRDGKRYPAGKKVR